jgi:long-chain acyl-CoA synthetase
MIGYWRDAAATARAVDDAGWLATGDIAEKHAGRLRIAGRLKEMIVLSIGEKVNPNLVEAAICRDPVFAQVAVVGEGRRFLAALAVLDKAAWQQFAAANGLDANAPDAAAAKARLLALIGKRAADLPRHAQVRALYVTLEPWTIEQGLLTPTLKIKRDALQRQFAQEIGTLYDEFEGRRRNGAAGLETEVRSR